MIPLFQGLQEKGAGLEGACLAHEASTPEGVALGFGHGGRGIGQQVVDRKRRRMPQMGIQGRQQRGAFLHNAHAGVTTPVNAALMPLGVSEPSLQVQIVARQVQVVGPDEQPRRETVHRPGHLSGDGVPLVGQGLLETLEPPLAVSRRSLRRIERGGYVADGLDVREQRFLLRLDVGQPAVDAPRQASQLFLGRPFFSS